MHADETRLALSGESYQAPLKVNLVNPNRYK